MNRLVFILPMLTALVACQRQATYYEESGSVFRTLYHIKYRAPQSLTAEIDAELKAFDASLNPFNPKSVLSRINRNEEAEADDWLVAVFNRSREVYDRSGGKFDPTVAPLINLWGFGFERRDSVTPTVVDSLLQLVGYHKVRLDGRRVVKDDPRMLLNFSAIAKGYACDVIAALLERHGVDDYMVEIGGEVTSKGVNPHGKCWQIGLNKPEDDSTGMANELQAIVSLCGRCGLATSGNYRNYYIKDGKKYAHTIDPHTGYPSENNLLSATVLAPDCMTADAYATAFMAMGLDASLSLAAQLPDIHCYFIYTDTADGSIRTHATTGMQQRIVKEN